jgi:uncharacterized protein (UPF0332 family)
VTPRAASRLAKAEGFLAQLISVSSTDAPAGAIHLAYYAMLHAASAVLLDRFGEAPKTHAGTIGRFSQAVMANDEGKRFGRALSKAEQLRVVSDYDDGAVPIAADAESTRKTAIEFVAYCRSLL